MREEIRFLTIVLIIFLTMLLVMKFIEVRELKHEQEAYKWRQFTCKTLLDDRKTRAIMCAK